MCPGIPMQLKGTCWHNLDKVQEAAFIGQIDSSIPYVLMETETGSEPILEELEDDPLPRIG